MWETRISWLPNRADSWLLLTRLKHKQFGNNFLQNNPITVLDRIFPQKNLLEGGFSRNHKQRPLIYVRTIIPHSLRENGGKLKKRNKLLKRIKKNQPFRTQYSYRSNAQEQAKIEIRNSIFWGESRTLGKIMRKIGGIYWKNPKAQDDCCGTGMINYWKVKLLRFRSSFASVKQLWISIKTLWKKLRRLQWIAAISFREKIYLQCRIYSKHAYSTRFTSFEP